MTSETAAVTDLSPPLHLTSPHMRGQRVRDAQWLLSGHNVWHDKPSPIHTYYGRLDGEYGPATASAAKRAKYWLGYPTDQITESFGHLIYNLLHGDSLLSAEFAATREQRIKASVKPVKAKALEIAKGEVGIKEAPHGSNCQKYGAWYQMNCCPWCAIFASYCISHAWGKDWKYSYVPNIVSDAVRGVHGMTTTYSPQPGDLVAFSWNGWEWEHVEIFDHWISESQGTFMTVGGNTGLSNFSNGGEVMSSERYTSTRHQFIRLTL